MKSRTIRRIILLTLLASAGIIVTQIVWVRKVYTINEQTFNLNVNIALRNTAVAVMHDEQVQAPKYSPVEQITPECFIVQTNAHVGKDVLLDHLITEFTAQNILTDFQYGLSDCNHPDNMEYMGYYHMSGTGEQRSDIRPLPRLQRENHYFGVYFPHRRQFLISQLTVLMASSALLLCVIGLLCYLLYIIFKQRRLSEVQKDFVSNMTHEFKTPLAAIRLSADVLKNPAIIQQPQRLLSYATIISNESSQLSAQVERILQMARAEKSGVQLQQEDFVWQNLLQAEAEVFNQFAAAKNGAVGLYLPKAPVYFRGDILHLKAALGNLIDNSVKYCDACPKVEITLKQTDKIITVTVRDNGIGIDRAHQRLLFDQFYRVPTGNVHNVKGFGLGLNYVRLIIKAHGGTVSVSSQLGKGSTFTLTFPHSPKTPTYPDGGHKSENPARGR